MRAAVTLLAALVARGRAAIVRCVRAPGTVASGFVVPVAFALTAAAATSTFAADAAREDRWAQEVVPSLVVGDAVYLATPSRPKVLAILAEPAGTPKGGIVVVHGLGVHPDWGLNGAVRTGLADAGFVTLSVQMPVLAADAARDDYRATFPQAAERIGAAIAYLRAKGLAKIGLVSHSLGASMVDAYLARADAARVDAWAPLGMFGAFAASPREPVLDVLAESEIAIVDETAPARRNTLPRDACSRQLRLAGTDHYFEHRQAELVATLAAFFGKAFAGECGPAPRS